MRKKTFFKILATVIVFILLAMIMTTYTQATITTTTNTGRITVSGIESGVTVSAYQITSVNYDYTADQPTSNPYSWITNVQNWINTNYSDYSTTENFYDAVNGNAQLAQEFYSALAAAIKSGQVTLTPLSQTATGTTSYPVTEDKLTGSVSFENCAMGTYLILIENGYKVYTPSAVSLVPEYTEGKGWNLAEEVTVTVKSTNPQITKTITDETAVKDNYSTKDTMTFTILADVPNYLEESLAKSYYISDKFTNGTINTSTIAVQGINGSVTTDLSTVTGAYTLTTSNAQRPTGTDRDVDFLLNFDYSKISGYKQIKVTYQATLNKDNNVAIGSTGNQNHAYLDYSNNPYVVSSYQTQDSSNTVYTYGVEVTKVKKGTQETLTGAEFKLDNLYFIKTADGVYYQANSGDSGATQTLVVNGQGKLFIYGLDAGTYNLTETKAPESYNISTTPEVITITDDNKDGILDSHDGNSDGIYDNISFENSQGFTLPVTGGIGTVVFVATGVVIAGLGIGLLIFVFKKNRVNK